jgi:hypothetical protein
VAFSPNGLNVITGSWDDTARLWDVASGQELSVFTGHGQSVYSVAFSPDGQYVLTGSSDNTARLWDIATGETLRRYVGHTGSVHSVAFSPDGRLVLTGSSDGTVRIWDTARDEARTLESYLETDYKESWRPELAQLISFDDGTWAVIDSEGRFDASNGGQIEGVHWVAGFEAIELSQLKDRYYEPGLLGKILGLNKEPLRKVSAFSDVLLFPELSLAQPDGDSSLVRIGLRNRGGGFGRVVVAVNGKEVSADARGESIDNTKRSASISVDLTDHPYLRAGVDNTIEVRVYNTEGDLASRGETVTWRAPGVEQSEAPEFWAVIAGVSDYSGDALDLNFAAKDAVDFADALEKGAQRLFGDGKVHIRRLAGTGGSADMPPTRDNLVAALQQLADARPTDVVLVYLAGHAVTHGGQDGDYYYLTRQATSFELNDSAVRSAVALSSDELTELMKLTPATKQVLILDTCGSGKVVESMSSKRGVPSNQTRALDRMKDRTGLFILAGSASDAVSYEASAYGQGLLTYSLLEGMRGAALREDEFVDVSAWFGYAADRVPAIAANIGGIQRPMVAMPRGSGSFDVARLTAADRRAIDLKQPLPFIIQARFELVEFPDDPLGLTQVVNSALREVGSRGAETPWVFVDTSSYAGGYRLSGRYSVNEANGEVSVDVFFWHESELIGRDSVAGSSTRLDALIEDIIEIAESML